MIDLVFVCLSLVTFLPELCACLLLFIAFCWDNRLGDPGRDTEKCR